jgi:hypothetical protein
MKAASDEYEDEESFDDEEENAEVAEASAPEDMIGDSDLF